MSTLKNRLNADLRTAMKAHDKDTLSVLRMVLGDIATQEKSGKTPTEFDDVKVLSFLQKESKKRKDTAGIYADAGHADRAANELAEAAIIDGYLPVGLTEAEIVALVDAEVAKIASPSMRDMGTIVKTVLAAANGGTDGKTVSALVRARLA